jgi:hypothetical protein
MIFMKDYSQCWNFGGEFLDCPGEESELGHEFSSRIKDSMFNGCCFWILFLNEASYRGVRIGARIQNLEATFSLEVTNNTVT